MTGFAKIGEVHRGVALRTDNGFTCLPANARRIVRADEFGELWIACRCGRHYLDGQLDDNDQLVGLELVL